MIKKNRAFHGTHTLMGLRFEAKGSSPLVSEAVTALDEIGWIFIVIKAPGIPSVSFICCSQSSSAVLYASKSGRLDIVRTS